MRIGSEGRGSISACRSLVLGAGGSSSDIV